MHAIALNTRNNLVLRALAQKQGGEITIVGPGDGRDPYMGCGSHPDIVERVWDQLGKDIPDNSRWIACGTPILADRNSGLILAVCYGTAYCIRVPIALVQSASEAGCSTTHKWSNGSVTDIAADFGPDWVFGCWSPKEEDWIQPSVIP